MHEQEVSGLTHAQSAKARVGLAARQLISFLGHRRPAAMSSASKWTRQLIVCLSCVVGVQYLWWRTTDTLPPWEASPFTLFAHALLGIEVLAIYIAVSGIEFPTNHLTRPTLRPFFIHHIDRRPEAARQLDWYGSRAPRIDIFLPTYSEPWEVLEKTFVGALNQSYPNFRVWVLDDGRRDWLRQKADALGIGYLSRPNNAHYKAGNINHALCTLRSNGEALEFIGLLDADFIARPEFLRRTIALMKDQRVGLVQTPQVFYNPDPFQRVFGVRNWPEEQRYWFDVEEPSLDATGNALCCGTGCLIRIAALDAIGGGFPTQSVTEDTLCSIRMKAAGWLTAYLPERLAVGLAAEGLHEWFTQRVRWLKGELQNRKLAGPPPRIWDRLNYWLSFLQLSIQSTRDLMWAIAVVAYWFTGSWVIEATPAQAALHFIPLWLPAFYWAWLSKGRRNYLVLSAQFKLQRFVWLCVPILTAFSSRSPSFEVTEKARKREQLSVHWRALRWHALLLAALVGGVAYNLLDREAPARGDSWFWINLLVSLYLVAETSAAIAPTIEHPQRRSDDRYETREAVELFASGTQYRAGCRNISLSGMLLVVPSGDSVPEQVTLKISEVGLVRSTLVRQPSATLAAFRFESPELRPALIRKLYCSDKYVPLPDRWRLRDGVFALLSWLLSPAGRLWRRLALGYGSVRSLRWARKDARSRITAA